MGYINNFLKKSLKTYLNRQNTIQEFYTVKIAEPLKPLSFFLKDES